MGERLNIEILKDGKVLANSYYHWSGYTRSSLGLTQHILNNLNNVIHEDEVLRAIKLLETTGAGLTDDEKVYAGNVYKDIQFGKCSGRNEGLIAVSEEGIKTTRRWEEARVQIHIDTEKVDFGAYWKYEKEEHREDYHEDQDELQECDIKFNGIAFSEFEAFNKAVYDLIENDVYWIRLASDPKNVYGFIE